MSVIGESLPRPLAPTPTASAATLSVGRGGSGGSAATPPSQPTTVAADGALAPSLARAATATAAAAAPAKKKACCVCPDTKRIRDECVVMNGEEACATAIAVHKACMRAEGF